MIPEFEEHKDLTHLTTFGIPASARWYAEYSSKEELLKISRSDIFINNEVLNIGSGSNLLFVNEYKGLVLRSRISGIKKYIKDESTIYVIAGAGVEWTEFVDWCIDHDLAGVENMAGIPGTVGASAVQNVGAYGMEASDVIHNVECFDTLTRQTRTFKADECRFGYRDSFFKHEGKERYIVLRVSFLLTPGDKAGNLDYKPLREFTEQLDHTPSLREVADEVIRIRNSKLPDPRFIGSAGSFFKNPVISKPHYDGICHRSGMEISAHQVGESTMKLSAAWLIDKAGMKGYSVGDAKVWDKQPLVIVNTGNATARDVIRLVDDVRSAVRRKFFIDLFPEVNYIDTSINVTVLGSGTSKGVPEVACECEVCLSSDPRDKRLRSSILVNTHGMNILIDASPDFRCQAIDNRIFDIDAVLVTHIHYDHVGGIDDLRPFCAYGDIPLYCRKDVGNELKQKLDYCFSDHHYPGVPTFHMHIIDNYPFYINGLKVEPIEVIHGKMPIYGYRIGNFAYITDAKHIAEEEKEKLYSLDTLIINGLRYEPHFAHFSIPETLQLIEEVKPRQAFITHLSHEAGKNAELINKLPDNVRTCFDGMKINIL